MSKRFLRLVLCIGLLASCKADKHSSRTDSVAVLSDTVKLLEDASAMQSLAGDTLTLVSVGDRPLPLEGTSVACDTTRTPVFQRIVIAADSTYWARTRFRPPCSDTLKASSDTVESRGDYRIFGDTIGMGVADPEGEMVEFQARIFPDSVVQIEIGNGKARRYSRRRGVPGDAKAMGSVRTDTVFLARDIDANGKPDYVIRESRLGPHSPMREYRLAIYLDADPGSRRPSWAMEWDWENGYNQALDQSLRVAPGLWLLDVGFGGGDYDGAEVLLAERGGIRKEISLGVDYGNGYMDITQEAGRVVIEATLDHLELRGTPVTSDIKCKATEWRAMRLVFDARAGHFTPERALCARIRVGDDAPPKPRP